MKSEWQIRQEFAEHAQKIFEDTKAKHERETDNLLRIIEEKDRTIAQLRRETDALTLVIRKVCR